MKHFNNVDENLEYVFRIDTGSQKVLAGTQSSVINAVDNEMVMISAISNCYIKVGVNPTASATDSMYLPVGTILPLLVKAGDKISVFLGDITITQ